MYLCVPIPFVHCIQVEGVGPSGRMYLFKRPAKEEQIETNWNLYLSAERDKETLKEKLAYQVPDLLVCVYQIM